MKSLRILACAAVLAAVCSLPVSASAFWPMYGSGVGGGWGGGWGGAGFYGPWYGTLHTAAYSPPPPYSVGMSAESQPARVSAATNSSG